MDVTPSNKMYGAMAHFVDAMCGAEPAPLNVGPGARAIRAKRRMAFEFLHRMVGIAMREGVNRQVREVLARQQAKNEGKSATVFDSADDKAATQGINDAAEGKGLIHLPH